jgi:signal transduction histidine kinase
VPCLPGVLRRCWLGLLALLVWLPFLLPAPAQAAPQLTEQQRAWIAAHPAVRVGLSVEFPPYYFASGRGRYEGFVIDLMDRVAARTGLKLQYSNFERFGDVLTAMREGRIDVTPFTSDAPGRSEFLRFVRPLFSTQMVIVTDRRIGDVSGDSGFGSYRVAVERGSTAAQLMRERFPQARVVEYDHGEKALLGVASGEADVFVGFRQVAAYYMEKHLTANLAMRGTLASPGTALGPAVRRDMPELAGILDAAIQDLSIEEITEIASRWLPRSVFVPQGGPKAALTPAQRQWVQSNGAVRLGYDEDFSPIAFKTAGGGFDGLAADLTRAVAGRVGLVIASEKGASFADVVGSALKSEIDVVVAAGRNAQRSLEFDFVGPFLRVPTVVVAASGQAGDITLDTPGPRRLALLKDHFLVPMLRSRYPNLQLLELPTQAAVLQAVRRGDADLAIGNMKVVNQLLESLHMGALRTVGLVPQGDSELYFAVRNTKPELAQVLRVGLDALTPAERAAIEERWLRVSWTEGIAWPRALLLAAVLVGVSALVVFSFWRSNQRLRTARRTLRDAHQAAEALAASRAHFTAYLTHELRGSLGGLSGGMAMLESGAMPAERRGTLVQAMHRSAGVLLDLCERTLDFERMLAGGVELQLAPLSVHETVQRAVAPWSVQAELKGLALRVDDRVEPGTWLQCDAVRLTQVLQNLLGNAVKFTAQGEVVLLVALQTEAGQEAPGPAAAQAPRRLMVSVSDSGTGVPEAERAGLFQPFTQGSEGRRARRGAGLGLSISAKIVEALGGEIELVASSPSGSTFAFWVPARVVPAAH